MNQRAFTLIELLVVIAIIGILAALLLPVLSQAKQRAQGAICLGGGKQMMLAVLLYADDHGDRFPPNPDDGNTLPGHNWVGGEAGMGGPEEFNPDVLQDPARDLIINYLGKSVAIFRCPADRRQGVYQGGHPSLRGQVVPAARTFSMNQAVGTICAGYDATGSSHDGTPSLSVNGPWLDDSGRQHRRNSPWRTYGRTSEVIAPGPSGLWVLIDEDAHGLNDAAFAVGMQIPGWLDWPGTYHNFGCGFSFADGHSETHHWKDGSTRYGVGGVGSAPSDPGQWHDWSWVTARTSARAN